MSTTASRRPAPRRSSLAGSTPATPPASSQPAQSAVPAPAPEQVASESAGEVAPAVSPAPQAGARRGKYPPKVSFYQDPADTARVRGAILHTMVTEGPRTLSQFIDRAVMAEVERLEVVYNDGAPFPSIAAHQLPRGRPLRQ